MPKYSKITYFQAILLRFFLRLENWLRKMFVNAQILNISTTCKQVIPYLVLQISANENIGHIVDVLYVCDLCKEF